MKGMSDLYIWLQLVAFGFPTCTPMIMGDSTLLLGKGQKPK